MENLLKDNTKNKLIKKTSIAGAFIRNKKRLAKGKYKYVYSYELPNGEIVHQSYISKYKWSAYHDSEKKAAIAVDMFLIKKGKEPINILVKK
jgi:hypothetical protein